MWKLLATMKKTRIKNKNLGKDNKFKFSTINEAIKL
jgi:hypothetical protein